jgi:mRNA interferase RelE/StbE
VTDSYSLLIKKSAEKELRGLQKADLARIVERIRSLAQQPRPAGCEKLSGQDRYRVRQGDYRIVYSVDDKQKVLEVVKIGHRREVYRE